MTASPYIDRIAFRLPTQYEPTFPALARWLLSITVDAEPPYRIVPVPVDEAPGSLDELLVATAGPEWHLRDDSGALIGTRVPVWRGASERTIWGAPEVNYAFRAWHDSLHILLGAEFDARGERRVALAHLARAAGRPFPERAALWAETEGQQEHHRRFGTFPEDQRRFVVASVDRIVARGDASVFAMTGAVRAVLDDGPF